LYVLDGYILRQDLKAFEGISGIPPPNSDHDELDKLKSDVPPAHWRHARLFNDVQAPRVESWNKQGGVSWVKYLPELVGDFASPIG
jgi:hypothetical protein